jgi:hypothetical protein
VRAGEVGELFSAKDSDDGGGGRDVAAAIMFPDFPAGLKIVSAGVVPAN